MRVYRISKTDYVTDLSGTGAKLYGGRWNHAGVPCIYTASSMALAVLEFSVNVNVAFVPPDLSIAIFEINNLSIFKPQNLPADWAEVPAPLSTKDFGSRLLQMNIPVVEIPSVVIPEERNYILNPSSKNDFQLIEVKPFTYDLRIKA